MRTIAILTLGLAAGIQIPNGEMVLCERKGHCLHARIGDAREGGCEFVFENIERKLMKAFGKLRLYNPDTPLEVPLPCVQQEGWANVKLNKRASPRVMPEESQNHPKSVGCYRGNKKLGSYISYDAIPGTELAVLCSKFRTMRHQLKKFLAERAEYQAGVERAQWENHWQKRRTRVSDYDQDDSD